MGTKYKYDWDSIPLGEMSDGAIAKKFGIPAASVGSERRKRGIPAYKKDKLEHERIDWSQIPFGTKSDADLGREFGIKASSISNARRRRGIPAFVPEGREPPARAKRGIDWDPQPLGQMPDRGLQRRLGLASVSSVSRARKYRGIPKYKMPTYTKLQSMYEELVDKWDSLEAVEARYKELSAQASEQEVADATG